MTLRYNLSAYPLSTDVFIMLLAGFGYLMTFLKRYGMSAIGFTMIVTVVVTQFSIIVFGFAKMDDDFVIKIGFIDVVEGGVTAAAVLISFGAILGKVNPLQLLIMGIFETIFVILISHLGYHWMGTKDVGGTIFIHTFGAYFGLAVSFCLRHKKTEKSEHLEGSRQVEAQVADPLLSGTPATCSPSWAPSSSGSTGQASTVSWPRRRPDTAASSTPTSA